SQQFPVAQTIGDKRLRRFLRGVGLVLRRVPWGAAAERQEALLGRPPQRRPQFLPPPHRPTAGPLPHHPPRPPPPAAPPPPPAAPRGARRPPPRARGRPFGPSRSPARVR